MKYLFSIALLFLNTQLFGSAIQIFAQSANSIGYAHADMAALADDASTAYYNPAGLTRIRCPQAIIGATSAEINYEFRGRLKGKNPLGQLIPFLNELIPGLNEPVNIFLPRSQGLVNDTLPNFHAAMPIPNSPGNITLGFSVVPTFINETEFFGSIITGYAERSKVQCIAFNPSIAIEPLPGLSLGVGYSLQKCSNLYTSSILLLGVEAGLESWELTWNAGALFQFNQNRTRFGITYRPKVTHQQTGEANFFNQSAPCKSDFILPGTVTAGFFHQCNCNFSIMGTIAYTMWNSIKEVILTTELQPASFNLLNSLGLDFKIIADTISVPFFWKDSYLIALGGQYVANPQCILKAGIAFDKTPTTNRYRELRIPDQNRFHFALGTRYCLSKHWSFDFGYQYIYLPLAQINQNPFLLVPLLQQNGIDIRFTVDGNMKSQASLFSGQLTCTF